MKTRKLSRGMRVALVQALRDEANGFEMDRPAVIADVYDFELQGDRFDRVRFDPEAIGRPEYLSAQASLARSLRNLREAGLLDGLALTDEGRALAERLS